MAHAPEGAKGNTNDCKQRVKVSCAEKHPNDDKLRTVMITILRMTLS
jgi:hypothetical protein